MHPRVLEIVESAGILARRLVLELSDDVTPDELLALQEVVIRLRRHGVMLAADSVPLGDEGLDRLIALGPDLVKLDGSNAAETGFDPALIEALTGEDAAPPAWLLATGVERPQDLTALTAAGIHLAQGDVVGHPEVAMAELSEGVREVLQSASESGPMSALGAMAKSSQVALTGPAVAVDGSGAVVGVVVPTRRGGVEVRPVTLAVHPERSLADVAKEAMARPIEHRYDPVVVTDDNGHVVGVIGTDDLMLHLAALADQAG
jgi:CBS domain-containing protein